MWNVPLRGYLLSCLPLKITACCSILCYGLCVPMGWLEEQRMGERRPDCSSKQVLRAFEDAHWLQANWIWNSGCACSQFNSPNQLITKTSVIIMRRSCRHVPAVTIIRKSQENDEREQIDCTLRLRLWDHCLAKIFDPLYIVCVYSWYSLNNKYCISCGT